MKTAAEKKVFGNNKEIPAAYAEVILEVLAQYPELTDTHIVFKLKAHHPVPYGTTPTLASILKKRANRVYHVAILTEAEPPVEQVLFHRLTDVMRAGVIAHELVHVLQFQSCSRLQLLKTFLSYPFAAFEKKLEIAADKGAIERGFGQQLYEHAAYIRSVPGYVEARPAVNENYLKPAEILAYKAQVERSRSGQ